MALENGSGGGERFAARKAEALERRPFRQRGMLVKPAYPLVFALTLLLLAGCLSRSLTGLQVLPASGVVTIGIGQSSQFQAQATYTESGHATTSRNVTNQATWVSSNKAVATIDATGLATGVSAGTATITGSMLGSFGPVSASSNVIVVAPASGTVGTTLTRVMTSLAVIPGSQTVTAAGETAQFIAIGTFNSGAPATQDVTDLVSWRSSDVSVAQVSSSGLVTGVGSGSATITALATSSDGSVTSSSGTVTDTSSTTGSVTLPTLTVFKVGSGAGTVKGYPVTGGVVGTSVITCGTGTGCVGSFPKGTEVMLVPTADAGSQFDGWSANCTSSSSVAYPNACSLMMTSNNVVGAIFDPTP